MPPAKKSRAFPTGNALLYIDCIAIKDEYGNTPVQRAELGWLLYNKSLEYAQLVLGGEVEHYLSLGRDHGRLEDQRHKKHSPALAKEKPKRGCIQ